MTFSSLLGNDFAKACLTAAASHQEGPQSLLLVGPKGVGKKTFAQGYAELLLGEMHCLKIQKGIHPDVICFEPEGKSHLYSIASIRRLLEEVSLPPFEAPYKVYILEEAERMLPSSSNALLKTLEEPLPCSRFLLLTSRAEELLPTIASRCVRIPFHPIEEDVLIHYLTQKQGVSQEKARHIFWTSQGSFSQAMKLVQRTEDHPLHSLWIEILRKFFLERPSASWIESFGSLEKLFGNRGEEEEMMVLEELDFLFHSFLFWLRDLHLLKETSSKEKLFYGTYIGDLTRQLAKGWIPPLEQGLLRVDEARTALQRSIKPRAVLETLLMRLSSD